MSITYKKRASDTFVTCYILELFKNSAQFPIANFILEILREGGDKFFKSPDPYLIIFSAIVQAFFLTKYEDKLKRHRLLGNLIGPALYTLVEGTIDGSRFFFAPHHQAYWVFAIVTGLFQASIPYFSPQIGRFIIVLENIARTMILFVMYAIFEYLTKGVSSLDPTQFFHDKSHQFIAWLVLLVGVATGISEMTSEHYLKRLRELNEQFHLYAKWLFGGEILQKLISNPNALTLSRCKRTILFMDIRGFTSWSEVCQPEEVVKLLNNYYLAAETVVTRHGAVKFKLSADEVMVVFSDTSTAIDAAIELNIEINRLLTTIERSVGIGLNYGDVVEGLLGNNDVQFFDVIGDTVNTAKRIESASNGGEVLISDELFVKLSTKHKDIVKHSRQIAVKGKQAPIVVHSLSCI